MELAGALLTQTGHGASATAGARDAVNSDVFVTVSVVCLSALHDWRSGLRTFGANRVERGDPAVFADVSVVVCLGDPARARAGHRRGAEPAE